MSKAQEILTAITITIAVAIAGTGTAAASTPELIEITVIDTGAETIIIDEGAEAIEIATIDDGADAREISCKQARKAVRKAKRSGSSRKDIRAAKRIRRAACA